MLVARMEYDFSLDIETPKCPHKNIKQQLKKRKLSLGESYVCRLEIDSDVMNDAQPKTNGLGKEKCKAKTTIRQGHRTVDGPCFTLYGLALRTEPIQGGEPLEIGETS